jgi:hypothetical protein
LAFFACLAIDQSGLLSQSFEDTHRHSDDVHSHHNVVDRLAQPCAFLVRLGNVVARNYQNINVAVWPMIPRAYDPNRIIFLGRPTSINRFTTASTFAGVTAKTDSDTAFIAAEIMSILPQTRQTFFRRPA